MLKKLLQGDLSGLNPKARKQWEENEKRSIESDKAFRALFDNPYFVDNKTDKIE